MALLSNEIIELRAPEPEDLEVFYRWENDTELWQYGVTLIPYSRYELRRYLSEAVHDIYQTGQVRLMVNDRLSGRPAGVVDLYDFDPHHKRAGVGILIDRAFRNQGRGRMAVSLVCEYAFSLLHLHQLFAYVPVPNVPSLELFKKNGFAVTGVLKDWLAAGTAYTDVYVLQIMQADFVRASGSGRFVPSGE
ncbi:MAG: GNAT family N-acetyltransferase [Parabacteroides sp.]|nr:GNAT family N-acetyltransferase [Parabacteroides sp.]